MEYHILVVLFGMLQYYFLYLPPDISNTLIMSSRFLTFILASELLNLYPLFTQLIQELTRAISKSFELPSKRS